MNTNALRQKILDLAIHGKLVKQDPADESAAILLEKIRAEKEKKIASCELKRGKNDSYIFFGDDNRHYEKFADGRIKDIEDEIPFAVPEGWAWCRLPNISASIFAGGDRPIIYEKTKSDKCNIPIYSNGIENNGLYGFTDKSVVNVSSLTISARGTIGFSCIRNEPFVPIIRLITIIPFIECINLVFLKFSFDALFSFSEGSSIPQLTVPTVKQFLLPLPPLSEQQRIVAKIETIFAEIDLMEQNKADLQTAVKQAKSKILDLAIRGKLVPQDPADEPASVMLERLRAEKEAKIAAGEMKRGKNDSYIYKSGTDNCYYQKYTDGGEENISDEIPFAVPDGWAWCRLPEVCRKPITDGTHNSPPNSASGAFLYITAKNIKNLEICLDDATYVSKEIHESIYSRCSPELNDVLLTKDGTIGEVAVNNLNYPFSMLSSVALIKPSKGILSWFLAYILISDLLQNKMKKNAKGSALKRIILTQINDFLIPLPPLAEQKRIVAKIEELFAQLDFITTTLTK
ncbi:restriction endonuclease subunit S [Treponema putidum]|uniref:restriction endonuclease subunit S n=2 Tax=Treponema putidum TaxID=221027 RepID=UPI0004F8C241|nr:restriction endonuclease subunit S [Treponema putidum]AIN93894.1 type I restriction-modification system [Treponema putidum]TWI78119.1 type I restriction enzyme S subunit [Treponema putidum]